MVDYKHTYQVAEYVVILSTFFADLYIPVFETIDTTAVVVYRLILSLQKHILYAS